MFVDDFRLSRAQNTPRFVVLFLGVVGEKVSSYSILFMFRIHFVQCWRNFLGCSRGVKLKVKCS